MASEELELLAAEEIDKIGRTMTAWANTWPDCPVNLINYNFQKISTGEESGMALFPITSSRYLRHYILGGYEAEFNFKLVYRIKPGESNDKRLAADELLNTFGSWGRSNLPDLGDYARAIKVTPTTLATELYPYDDGYEDHQIIMKLKYEVI